MAQRKEMLLSYKLKSKDVQQEIAELDNEIRKKMNEFKPVLKKRLIYQANARFNLFKIDLPKIDESVNVNVLQAIIYELKAKENEYVSYFHPLEININVVGTNMKNEIQECESQKTSILQQIRELGGTKFENTVINKER